jgi:acyl-CoA thioester hydrolase
VEVLYAPDEPLSDDGTAFVIACLELSFRTEISWPGEVRIGTRVGEVGRSSVTLEQGLFQSGTCVAVARTVIVQMDESTRRSRPLNPRARARLEQLKSALGDSG